MSDAAISFESELNLGGNFSEKMNEIVASIKGLRVDMQGAEGKSKTIEKNINGISGALQVAKRNAKAFAGTLAASAYTLNRLITGVSTTAMQMDRLSRSTGIAIDEFQQLSNVYSNLSGISVEQASSEISSLGKQIEDVKRGLADPSKLMMAGINVNANMSVGTAISDLQKSLSGMSKQAQSRILRQSGLSEGFVEIINASKEELEQLHKIPVLSRRQIDDVNKMRKGLDLLKKQVIGFKNQALADIAPAVAESFGEFFELINDNKDMIIDFIKRFTLFTKDLVYAVSNAGIFLGNMVSNVLDLNNSLSGLAVVFGAIAIAAFPAFSIFIALLGLVDDFATWKRGGESSFGGVYEILSKFPVTLDLIKDGMIAIGALWAGWKTAGMLSFLGPVGTLIGAGVGLGTAAWGINATKKKDDVTSNILTESNNENIYSQTNGGNNYHNTKEYTGGSMSNEKNMSNDTLNFNSTININSNGDTDDIVVGVNEAIKKNLDEMEFRRRNGTIDVFG